VLDVLAVHIFIGEYDNADAALRHALLAF
jgi:hypothetical protein